MTDPGNLGGSSGYTSGPPPPPPGHRPSWQQPNPPQPPIQVIHRFEPPKGYRLKRKRRWPWVLLALLVIGVISSAVAKSKDDKKTTTPAQPAAASPVPGIGGTDTTSGIQLTLLQSVDPWVSSNQYEPGPAAGRRYVAVELDALNVTNEQQVLSTLLGMDVVDSVGQHWNIAIAGLDLPQLDATLQPGERRRGWAIFEVPNESTGLKLFIRGSITASGITFQLT